MGIERRDRVNCANASWLLGAGFECSPVYRLSWQWFSLVSSVPPGKILDSRLPQIGHTCFFPRSFQFLYDPSITIQTVPDQRNFRLLSFNPLTPNDPNRGRTAPLTSKVAFYIFHHHHHHHMSVMELGHLLTRSGLTYLEVSSEVCHDSFFQMGNSVSLPWVICHEAFCLHAYILAHLYIKCE